MASPVRPSSRDSQSDYSSPTSFSSIEPPSGSASPGKPLSMSPQPPEEMPIQKKKGFFQNSPFTRRKSKHEKEPSASIVPASRNTWGPSSKSANNENASPARPFARNGRGTITKEKVSASPEPVDPRANFQLNIGNNVFDVASPDGKKEEKLKDTEEELDPIAQALAELKGVTKQTSLRVSADRYHGLATPQPPGTPAVGANLPGGVPTPLTNANLNAAKRGTPPPSYEQPPMSRLGAPQPAHTARQMQKTTQMYINQKANMFDTSSSSRPPTRGTVVQEAPRAASPAPPRAVSPQPSLYRQPPQQQPPQSPAYRSVSPNPYAASAAGGRPRAQTASQASVKSYGAPPSRGSYAASSRGGSPGHANIQRAVSPQPPPQPQPQPQSQPQPQPQPQSKPQLQPQPKPQVQPQPKPQAQPQPKPQPQPQPQPVHQPPPQAQPQPAYASSTRPSSRPSSRPGSSRPASRAAPSSRAVSPQPQFRQSYDRPPSSRSEMRVADMALQLAPGPGSERGEGSVYGGSVYGGSVRGRNSGTNQRPQSSYYNGGGSELSYSPSQHSTRVRSKSIAEPRQYTRDGRMILHYCKLHSPNEAWKR